jgi:outer membrane biosynthesis protein TonB
MEATEKKRKRKAGIITISFHVLVLILFLMFGLEQPDPLPEEAGASIEFGWDTDAGGDAMADISPEPVQEEIPQETTPVEPVVTESVVEEVASDEASDIAVPTEKESEPKPKEPTPVKEEPVKPKISDKLNDALNALSQPSGGGSQGDTEGTGDQGNPEGTEGKGALGGGSGSWQLDGRSMMGGYGTKITDTKEEGTVVLNIWVDQQGNVTKVQPNLRESNTTSQYLINLAKNDVLKNFKFNGDPKAAISQTGKVRYVFKLQ